MSEQPAMPVVLTPEQEALAQRTAELIVAFRSPVLTRDEAMVHTKHDSRSAFDRWCDRFGVKPCSRGRYARRWLDRALEKEAAQGSNRRNPKAA